MPARHPPPGRPPTAVRTLDGEHAVRLFRVGHMAGELGLRRQHIGGYHVSDQIEEVQERLGDSNRGGLPIDGGLYPTGCG